MRLQLGDVVRVKEDLQFYNRECGWVSHGPTVGKTFKVTTLINDRSVLMQECKPSGAVTHIETKRVRNPDMSEQEFSDYYEVLQTAALDSIEDDKLIATTAEDLMSAIGTPLIWKGPHFEWPLSPNVDTDPEIFSWDAEEGGAIASDGGSSSYYDISIPSWLFAKILERSESDEGVYIKTEELIEVAFDNDFDFGNLFKSLVRAVGKKKGAGKAGNTLEYECNKMRYSTDKIETLGGRGET